ncbi:ImmA/IrrE family metallo-endopeptidase [Trabulsiella odontotermitis]|uniref:ImmA/IrrE family metallo-endopeptidase n=1 Tax=Trabulsiella odontotermitis TaxID=379893 RepID=UPI0006BA3905|nr:ImmA/IrrE family metallo-endopeptidase [Trabulsiella odontotermitis]
MAVVEFQLSRKMIDWIADSQGLSLEALADQVMPKKINKFFNGIVTKSGAEKLAKIGGIPFGFLFLDNPPKPVKPKIPDLRQAVDTRELGRNFFDVYNDIEYKLEWYKEYLKENGNDQHLDFIGKFKYTRNLLPETVAQDIIQKINFNVQREIKGVTVESYFTKVAKLIENVGILVFKNGVVGNNNSRKLDTREFRGFCISDNVAPIVFVNGSDALSAQVFTLFHEVAHLWLGVDGVSGWDTEKSIEAFCNKVSAEILMPQSLFLSTWESGFNENDLYRVKEVSHKFKVSDFACAIRAIQLGLIDGSTLEVIKQEANKKPKKENSSGSFFNTLPVRNSHKLTNIIISRAMSQQLPLREAGVLLNVKADTIVEFHKKRESL